MTTLRLDITKRDFSAQEREMLAEEGKAMPDGSFPIASAADLSNALQSIGRAKDREGVLRHIRRRAKALDLMDKLPEWAVAKVVKCNCGAGDSTTLETLRETVLAEMDADEFNDVVIAVNKAGGILNTRGLPRLVIVKAIGELRSGVAKGDFVGHPFRGNQHVDASGAGRAGAGSGSGRAGAKSGYLKFERDARDFVSSQIADTALAAEGHLKRQMDGIGGIIATSQGAIDSADYKAERSENFESEDAARDRKNAKDVTRAETRLQRHAKQVKAVLSSLIQNSQSGRSKSEGGDIDRAYESLFSRTAQLQRLRSEIRRVDELERTASRQGFAGGKSVTGRYGLLLGAIREALQAVDEVQSEVNGAAESILQAAQANYEESRGA